MRTPRVSTAWGELFEGLEIANIASHAGNFALLDETEALAARQTVRRYLEWAAVLGARSVRIWPGWVAAPEAEPEHWERAARHLRWCAEAAADLDVMVAIECTTGRWPNRRPAPTGCWTRWIDLP